MSFGRRLLAILATVFSVLALSVTAASAGQSWPVEAVPSPPARTGFLHSVSCASADDCMAVGTFTDPHGVVRADSRRWNGQGWQRIATPTPPGSTVNLNGVACPAISTCLAVGTHGYDTTNASKTWGLLWNGTSWLRVPTPNPAVGGSDSHRDLGDLACGSPTFCVAVGFVQGSGAAQPLAAVWNGSTWTASATPKSSGLLSAVSCPDADRCIVLGVASKPFALQYLNGTWSTLPQPLEHGVSALSCVSATACTADGSDGVNAVVQTSDGTTWQRVKVPRYSHAIGTSLHGVSCASARRCVAVGEVADPNGKPTGHVIATALRWNGTAWSLMNVPSSTQQVASLSSVACPSEAHCVGVGYLDNSIGAQQPPAALAATWDQGSGWALHDPADRRGTSTGLLSSISCTDDQECIAVGQQQDATDRTVSFSEQRTAAGWSIVTLPDVKGPNYLRAVSCSAHQACLAVGQRGSTGKLVFRWTGSAWTTLAPPSDPAMLSDVSCPGTQNCVAVGQSEVDGDAVATVESWDGSSWTTDQLALPPGAFSAELNGVDCPSATSCTAVGDAWYSQEFGYTARPIEARLHAGAWTLTADTTSAATPTGVSCPSASSCVAVGIDAGSRAFAETYADGTWTVTAPLSPPELDNTALADVSCASTTRCIGVGWFSGVVERKNYGGTLIESWDGHAWSIESATNPVNGTSPQLNDVSCTGSGTCRAAGYTGSPYPVPLVQSDAQSDG